MTYPITHQKCPHCGHEGCFTTYAEGDTYCFSCHTVTKPTLEAGSLAGLEYKIVAHDGISKATASLYNILTGFDSNDKALTRVYPYPHDQKIRVLPKDFSKNKGFLNTKLFGMDKFTKGQSKVLVVVEGEKDAPSAHQLLQGKYPVVATPGSGMVSKVLKDKDTYDFVNSFESIVCVLDNDEAGKKLGADMARAFPNRVYAVHLSLFKDSNDYLQNNKQAEFNAAFHNRQKYVPDNILNTSEQFLSLFRDTPDHAFVPTGIEALDEKIGGIMRGYFTVIKAETGIGKTEVMRFMENSMINQGVPFAAWHLEETKLRSLLGLVSYRMADNVTQRHVIKEKGVEAEVEAAIQDMTKDELLYQFFMQDGDTADDLVAQIRYLADVCGIKYIFFEPIQDVITVSGEASKEAALAELSVRLSKLAAELNIAIVTIAHTNDDGEIKYCRMIGQRAGIILQLVRDKESSDETTLNTTHIYIKKNRPFSLEGYGGSLLFDPDSFTLEEVEG